MKYVEFYKLQNDGSQKIIAICRLNESGQVECDGDVVFVGNFEREGIKDYSSQEKPPLFFKDGLKFLEQLKFNFTSGYLNASEVMEK